jgi:flagellar assembly factor FliW
MEIQHRHLGRVTYSPEDVVFFPQGLLGFLKFKNYLFVKENEFLPFVWMVSTETPDVGFLLAEPMRFCPDYVPNITKRDLNELLAENPQSLDMYSIVTVNQDPHLATANLSGPILVNETKKIGKQLVLLDDRYSTKHRIYNHS